MKGKEHRRRGKRERGRASSAMEVCVQAGAAVGSDGAAAVPSIDVSAAAADSSDVSKVFPDRSLAWQASLTALAQGSGAHQPWRKISQVLANARLQRLAAPSGTGLPPSFVPCSAIDAELKDIMNWVFTHLVCVQVVCLCVCGMLY